MKRSTAPICGRLSVAKRSLETVFGVVRHRWPALLIDLTSQFPHGTVDEDDLLFISGAEQAGPLVQSHFQAIPEWQTSIDRPGDQQRGFVAIWQKMRQPALRHSYESVHSILPAAFFVWPNQFSSRHRRNCNRARCKITQRLVDVIPNSLQIASPGSSSIS